jgi:hypothetical protein
MTTLSLFFASLAASLPSRVLLALGVGWLSFTGYQTLMTTLINQFMQSYNTMPADLYQLFSLAGFTDGLGILLGAFSAKAAIYGIKVLGNVS